MINAALTGIVGVQAVILTREFCMRVVGDYGGDDEDSNRATVGIELGRHVVKSLLNQHLDYWGWR